MKNHFLILKGMLSVSLIVLSIAILVNYRLAVGVGSGNTRIADGVPLPPPTQPTPKLNVVLTADGVPLPPPTQPTPKLVDVLTADGVPLPPPTQPTPKLGIVFMADGVPLPPPTQPTPKLFVAA
jgi:hypothetical protein